MALEKYKYDAEHRYNPEKERLSLGWLLGFSSKMFKPYPKPGQNTYHELVSQRLLLRHSGLFLLILAT
jgi:hypothetical protein